MVAQRGGIHKEGTHLVGREDALGDTLRHPITCFARRANGAHPGRRESEHPWIPWKNCQPEMGESKLWGEAAASCRSV